MQHAVFCIYVSMLDNFGIEIFTKTNIMETRKFTAILMALVTLVTSMTFFSCSKDETTPPTVKLTEVTSTESSLTFLAEISGADEGYYMYKAGADASFTADEIVKSGIRLSKAESQKIEVSGLEADTEYSIAAVARNKAASTMSTVLKMKTIAQSASGLSVSVTPGEEKETELSFTIVPSNAEKVSYVCLPKSETLPTADEIFKDGKALDKVNEASYVTVSELMTKTEYMILAAASNGSESIVSKAVYMTTKEPQAGAEMDVLIEDIEVTYNSVTFTIIPKNAGGVAYDYQMKEDDSELYEANDVWYKGKKLESADMPSTVTISDLRDDQSYIIYAVVESASSYDRKLTYCEIKTEKRPDPSELPEEIMNTGKMTYQNGNKFSVNLENDKYKVNLDIYEDLENPEYKPHIQPHEYTLIREWSDDSWILTFLTSVTDKNTGSNIKLAKGTLNIEYNVPEYTLTGRFITDDNQAFNFKYTGELPYRISADKGEIKTVDGNNEFTLACKNYNLNLKFGINEITGTHTIGESISTESSFSLAIEGANQSYKLTEGNLNITENGSYYGMTGSFTLDNGDKVSIEQTDIIVEKPVDPGKQEIVFDTAEARGGPDMTGWLTAYDITLENEEWSFYLAFETSGEYDELPTGKLLYTSWGGSEISAYTISHKTNGSINDLDEGYLNVTKEGDTYTIEVNFTRDNGDKLIGKYVGPVVCEDMSGYAY